MKIEVEKSQSGFPLCPFLSLTHTFSSRFTGIVFNRLELFCFCIARTQSVSTVKMKLLKLVREIIGICFGHHCVIYIGQCKKCNLLNVKVRYYMLLAATKL